MKISKTSIYKTHFPYVGDEYVWGAGNQMTVATAAVVVIETDTGISGGGEFTPFGENYMKNINKSGGWLIC